MAYSLSRTLVVRFALTMFVALLLIALWAYLGTQRVLQEQLEPLLTAGAPHEMAALAAATTRRVLWLMLGTVLLGTVATTFGAAWLARVAVGPVAQITDQAHAIQPDTTGNRITVHADVVEYRGLVDVLNRMLTRLDQAVAAQRRIIADVGHDLRSPLTAMRGEMELALRHDRSPEQYRAVLASALEETERLSAMSDALIILARADAGQLVPRLTHVALAEIAGAAIERISARADGRTFTLTPRGDARAWADPALLSVVLDQLLDNTVRHTPPGTRVGVVIETTDYHVELSVSDSGPGLPADALPHLLKRFYRADAARSRAAGAGLGLSVAAAIMAAHGGYIRAAAGGGGGLEIRCTLPRGPIPS